MAENASESTGISRFQERISFEREWKKIVLDSGYVVAIRNKPGLDDASVDGLLKPVEHRTAKVLKLC